MAEALGVVGSIVTVLQLSTKVVEYLSTIKDASEDRQRLLAEIYSSIGLLYMLKEQSQRAGPERIATTQSLGAPGGPVEQFHHALEELVPKLFPVKGLKKAGKVLSWPFKKEEIMAILRRIERQKSLFSLALQNDHIGLSQAIRGDVADLSQGVKEMRITQRDDTKDRVLQWLSSTNPSSNHNAARKKHEPSTGAWLLRSQSFIEWKNNANSFLWLHGIPGCGKTILCSTVIENIGNDYANGMAYYYFDFNDKAKQDANGFLRSVIAQLSRKAETLPDNIQKLHDQFHRDKTEPSLETLCETLVSVIQGHDTCFLVLDALDESEGEDVLAMLSRIASRGLGNLHMLVTSRKERHIEGVLAPIVTGTLSLSLDSTNVDADIGLYVHHCLATVPKLKRWPDPVKREIETSLTEGAHGMFRWAECQITALRLCKTEASIRKALKQLPRTLDETYDRILLRIPEEDRQMARSALLWLAFSERPLYLDEVAEAAILSPGFCTLNPEDRLFDSHDIIDMCSGLVTSVPGIKWEEDKETNKELLRFAHFSVKEYLISDRITEGNASAFAMLGLDAQTFLAGVCISYLLLFNDNELSSMEEVYANPLLEYAAELWYKHASNNLTLPAITISQMHTLFRPRKGASFLNWLRIYNPDFEGRGQSLHMKRNLNEFASPLYYASLFGRLEVASSLLDEGADIQAECGFFENALTAAAHGGHESVVQLLLSQGADIKAKNRMHGSALCAAAGQGHEPVVRLLLSQGAYGNKNGEDLCPALSEAAKNGHESVIQLLLSSGASVNPAKDKWMFGSPLQLAAKRGHVFIVQTLLAHGADIEFAKDYFKNALEAAASGGYVSVMRLLLSQGADLSNMYDKALRVAARNGHVASAQFLLDLGADVNAQGGEYGSALQVAALRGAESVVQLLLKAGADVNAQGGRYGSALQAAAAWRGAESVVQLLLKAGANVNAQGGEYGSALQAAAARRGAESVVQLLLKAGADVNAQCGKYGGALQAAAWSGAESVVQLLLKAGADVNAQGGEYGSALGAAVAGYDYHKMPKVLQLLRAGAAVPLKLEDNNVVQKALAILKQEAIESKDS